MKHFFGFHTLKAVLALLGADWGCQTYQQALYKNRCWKHRARHVAAVASVQGLSAWTAQISWRRWLWFVGINAGTHFLIDSVRLPKALDQALHIGIAVATAPLLKGGDRE